MRTGKKFWAGDPLQPEPRKVFVTHGEPTAADAMRLAIEELGWKCAVPNHGESELL